MNPIFAVPFVIGYILWILIDYSKVRDSVRSKIVFIAIQVLTAVLFVAVFLNFRMPNPVTAINEIIYPWAQSLIGEISYVKIGD
ncbi:hypothetical protein [Paenibacillus senegalensis]|uniref:hypothetical protein n=1 Tax=Paenibacillus senegalensis TaxID=1465766 RepID=UPI000289882E|nr:hypothetical protein [Paenibacillus senegalensis]